MYLIYKYTSPSGKSYIGQTNKLTRRISKHKQSNSPCINFRKAINKYGYENFKLEILVEHLTLDEANILEEQFIKEHNTIAPNGYNLTPGGLNHKKSEEQKQKISIANKGKPKPPFTIEHRQNLSIAHQGVPKGPQSPEHIQKRAISRNRKGMKRRLNLETGKQEYYHPIPIKSFS